MKRKAVYIFETLFNVLNRRQLDSPSFFCIQSVAIITHHVASENPAVHSLENKSEKASNTLVLTMKIVLMIMDSLKGSRDPQGFPGHTLRTADLSNAVQEKANGDGI